MNKSGLKMSAFSCEQACRNKYEGTVLLLGDSMTRGIGDMLHKDNVMFRTKTYGGARIEKITRLLKQKQVEKINKDSHLVVMVGTNNLKSGTTENIARRYKELVSEMKKLSCRKLSMIGILTRGDEDEWLQGKRISINLSLQNLCEENEIEFMDTVHMYDSICARENIDRNRVELEVLDENGLHLNEWGKDQMARSIFKHCIKYIYECASNLQTSESIINKGRSTVLNKERTKLNFDGGKLKCFYVNARSIINKRQ